MRRLPPLGTLSPREFMARHWQRRPLLVRGALLDLPPPLSRTELFALAARDDVESRLVRTPRADGHSRKDRLHARHCRPCGSEIGRYWFKVSIFITQPRTPCSAGFGSCPMRGSMT